MTTVLTRDLRVGDQLANGETVDDIRAANQGRVLNIRFRRRGWQSINDHWPQQVVNR